MSCAGKKKCCQSLATNPKDRIFKSCDNNCCHQECIENLKNGEIVDITELKCSQCFELGYGDEFLEGPEMRTCLTYCQPDPPGALGGIDIAELDSSAFAYKKRVLSIIVILVIIVLLSSLLIL